MSFNHSLEDREKSLFDRIKDRIVVEENGCWSWTGLITGGYPNINIDGHARLVHRATYEDKYGKIPEELFLDHLCKRPHCVNPDHLEPVTKTENDRRRTTTKLTREDVIAIRASTETQKELSKRFGVSVPQIQKIKLYKRWRDV